MSAGQRHSGSMDWSWMILVLSRVVSFSPDDRWALVLSRLDSVRADAFSTGDPSLLDGVYVRRSSARRSDEQTLEGFASRGARVVGAELRVLSCRVVSSSPHRVRLEVVDRLRDSQVVWSDGTRTALPRDEPSRHVVALHRTTEGWRIAGVRAQVSSSPRR